MIFIQMMVNMVMRNPKSNKNHQKEIKKLVKKNKNLLKNKIIKRNLLLINMIFQTKIKAWLKFKITMFSKVKEVNKTYFSFHNLMKIMFLVIKSKDKLLKKIKKEMTSQDHLQIIMNLKIWEIKTSKIKMKFRT